MKFRFNWASCTLYVNLMLYQDLGNKDEPQEYTVRWESETWISIINKDKVLQWQAKGAYWPLWRTEQLNPKLDAHNFSILYNENKQNPDAWICCLFWLLIPTGHQPPPTLEESRSTAWEVNSEPGWRFYSFQQNPRKTSTVAATQGTSRKPQKCGNGSPTSYVNQNPGGDHLIQTPSSGGEHLLCILPLFA